ncbi:tRNA lysidine(34) synthetase TilS [Psychromonas ossibalaenae]|uniref:tRNA lysidine(34) synthetase TilS n=1 Tax=Psychromonas ossibalaenae TaxID=444922 RepID=UPI000366DCAC|nr:tRNA lysidine(34) synthetase TilS [Psychromonas ossibalaenae]
MTDNDLLDSFSGQLNTLAAVQDKTEFHIALSGGLDSVVLLHLFARLRNRGGELSVCGHHVDHGLSANAQAWTVFCRDLCKELNIKFITSQVSLVKKSRTSIEALAREKRYLCLTEKLSEKAYLVTAHHQDDQLETVLLALKRGSGNTGLQGILSKQKLTCGHLIRPLLNFSRQQLESYAQAFALKWIEDESNSDQVFDRNFIRHSITPLLKQRWPAITKTAARTASLCQEQQTLLDEIGGIDFQHCSMALLNQQVVDISSIKELSIARRNNVLRYWFKENNYSYPSSKQLLAIWQDVVLAGEDALPEIQFKGYSVRRYRGHLYLVKDLPAVSLPDSPVVWAGEAQLNLLDGRVKLQFSMIKDKVNNSDSICFKQGAEIAVCFRQQLPAKLSCRPAGRNGSRTVKKLLHEYHVPPWLRDFVPFILINGKLSSAVGLWQCTPEASGGIDSCLTVRFA